MEKDAKPLASTREFNEAANDLVTASLDILDDAGEIDSGVESIEIVVRYSRRTNEKSAKIHVNHIITKEVD